MTFHELADRMERIAQALRKIPDGTAYHGAPPHLEGDFAVGAALLWNFLHGLLTDSTKDVFTRDELLVLLETMSRDAEIFPPGVVGLIANCQEAE